MLYYGWMMSHVYEALSIVGDIQKSASLTKAVENCDRQTRASFDAVAAFPTCPEYEMLAQIRNSTGFQLAKLGGQKSEQAPVLGSLLRLLLVLSLAPPQAGRSALAKSSVGADAVSDSSGEPRRDLLD